jgi:hypothetical protein
MSNLGDVITIFMATICMIFSLIAIFFSENFPAKIVSIATTIAVAFWIFWYIYNRFFRNKGNK